MFNLFKMAEYEFNFDRKVSLWHRTSFSIKASSKKAQDKIKHLIETNVISEFTTDILDDIKEFEILNTEYLYDTVEEISSIENNAHVIEISNNDHTFHINENLEKIN